MTFFLKRARNVIFAATKKNNLFERCRSDDILQSIEIAFLLRLISPGERSGISQVASKIRRHSSISTISRISVTLMIFAKIILHTFILILRSNIEVVEWELLLSSNLPTGRSF